MDKFASYTRSGDIGRIVMDDGKANVKSIKMLADLHKAFDEAERDRVVAVLTGVGSNFSAGFDLKVFGSGTAEDVYTMQKSGVELAYRIMSFPAPIVASCNGNAYPMGAFLIMSSDFRIGSDGPFKIGLNEVTIGLTLPSYAIAIARHRLTPTYLNRSTVTGEMFGPSEAVTAGFLDKAVPEGELEAETRRVAEKLAQIDFKAHLNTKLEVRKPTLDVLRKALDEEITLENARKWVAMRDGR